MKILPTGLNVHLTILSSGYLTSAQETHLDANVYFRGLAMMKGKLA